MTRAELLQIAKPILFNTDMTVAILEDRKTVTRRLIKPQLSEECPVCKYVHNEYIYDVNAQNIYCARCGEPLRHEKRAPYQPGDILYVRETWCELSSGYEYKANGQTIDHLGNIMRWHPSIHMPKEAARIFLKVKDVRVEKLQDITEEQALSEGVPDDTDYPISKVYCPRCHGDGLVGALSDSLGFMEVECHECDTAVKRFKHLWDSTIKKSDLKLYGWDVNPWVWKIEFERIEPQSEGE